MLVEVGVLVAVGDPVAVFVGTGVTENVLVGTGVTDAVAVGTAPHESKNDKTVVRIVFLSAWVLIPSKPHAKYTRQYVPEYRIPPKVFAAYCQQAVPPLTAVIWLGYV